MAAAEQVGAHGADTQAAMRMEIYKQAGIDEAVAREMVYGPAGENVIPQAEVLTEAPPLDAIAAGDSAVQITKSVREDLGDTVADSLHEGQIARFMRTASPDTMGNTIRHLREAKSYYQKGAANWFVNAGSKFQEFLQSKPVQTLMGMAEPAGRAQQSLFAFLAGHPEEVGPALFPTVVVGEDEWSPWQAAMNELWTGLTGTKEEKAQAHNIMRQVNEAHYDRNIRMTQDLFDSWVGGAGPFAPDPTGEKALAGRAEMDQFYSLMNENNAGRVGMGMVATLQATGDIYADPLFLFADVGPAVVRGARRALPAAARAKAARAVAATTGKLLDTQEAVVSAKAHYENAFNAARADPTVHNKARLLQAEKLHLEAERDLARASREYGPHEQVTFDIEGMATRKPEAVKLDTYVPFQDEVWPLSPTRGVPAAQRKKDTLAQLSAKKNELLNGRRPSTLTRDEKRKLRGWRDAEKRVRKGDDIPDVIMVDDHVLRTRTHKEILEDRQLERWNALREVADEGAAKYRYTMDSISPEHALQRALIGPSTPEQAGDGLALLAKGATVNDFKIHAGTVPGYFHETSIPSFGTTADGLLDVKAINKKLAKAGKKKVKAPKEAEKFDDSWLPVEQRPLTVPKPANWQERFADRLATGLYPHTWRMPVSSVVRFATSFLREPQYMVEIMDPGGYRIIKNASIQAEKETQRFMYVAQDAMERFGAISKSEPSKLRKVLLSGQGDITSVNAKRSAEMYRLLDVAEDTEDFAKLLRQGEYTDDQLDAVLTLRKVLDHAADKQGLSGPRRIKGYVNHVIDADQFSRGARPPEMMNMSGSSHVFLAHLLDRKGTTLPVPEDIVGAMDVYMRGMSRKLYMEPAFEQLSRRTKDIVKDTGNSWYLNYSNWYIDNMKGRPSVLGDMVDRNWQAFSHSIGRPYKPNTSTRTLAGVYSMVYGSLLAGSIKYPFMALSTALNTTPAKYGMFRTAKGLFNWATPEGQLLSKAAGIDKAWSQVFDGSAWQSITDAFSKFRGPTLMSVHQTESALRGTTFLAAIDEHLNKLGFENLNDAMKAGYGNKIVQDATIDTEQVCHLFGTGSRPPWMNRLSKSGAIGSTQFLSFMPKQTEAINAVFKDNPGNLMRYIMLAGWINGMAADDMGLDITDYTGFGYLPKGPRDVTSPGTDFLLDFLNFTSLAGRLAAGEPVRKDFAIATDKLASDLPLLLPFANLHTQIANTAERYTTGEKYSSGGRHMRTLNLDKGGTPQEPDELIAVFTQLQSVKDTMHQDAIEQYHRDTDEQKFESFTMMQEMVHAIKSDNWDIAEDRYDKLIARGWPLPELDGAVGAAAVEKDVGYLMQEMMKNPARAPILMNAMDSNGVLMSEQLGEAK